MSKIDDLVIKTLEESTQKKNVDVEKIIEDLSEEEKKEFYIKIKRTIAYLKMTNSKPMHSKCYDYKHRNSVPGSAHSSCKCLTAEVFGEEHGINKGWFLWPFDFDPVWLKFCDSFEDKECKS